MKAQKILVPIDFSMGQERTLSLAASLASDAGAKLVIVHVMEPALAYAAGGAYYGAPNPREDELGRDVAGSCAAGIRCSV